MKIELMIVKKLKVTPWTAMNDKWKISEKDGRENYFEKVFSLWKKSYLPSKLQNFCLLHVNNHYNYNIQLNKNRRDEKGDRIPDTCTFCKLPNFYLLHMNNRYNNNI